MKTPIWDISRESGESVEWVDYDQNPRFAICACGSLDNPLAELINML